MVLVTVFFVGGGGGGLDFESNSGFYFQPIYFILAHARNYQTPELFFLLP